MIAPDAFIEIRVRHEDFINCVNKMKTDCQVETISLSIELGLDMYKYSLDLCT